MSIKNVGKGERLQGALKAETWNAFVRAANANDMRFRLNQDNRRPSAEDPYSTCKMMASTSALERREIVGIDTPSITPTEGMKSFESRQLFAQSAPIRGKFAAAEKASAQNVYTPIITDGVFECKLFVPTNGDWIKWADIDPSDATRLLAVPNGSAQILWKDTGTNQVVDAIVRIGNPQYREVSAKAVGVITPDVATDNQVQIWQNKTTDTGYTIGKAGSTLEEEIHLDWMHGDLEISDGKEVLIGWFPSEQLWRVVGAECEDPPTPVLGQMSQTDGNVDTFAATTVYAPLAGIFDATSNLNTPNVTIDAANASITLPAIQSDTLYEIKYAFTVAADAQNTDVVLRLNMNSGSAFEQMGVARIRTAGDTQSMGGSAYFQATTTGVAITLQVECTTPTGNTTLTFYDAIVSITKWAED